MLKYFEAWTLREAAPFYVENLEYDGKTLCASGTFHEDALQKFLAFLEKKGASVPSCIGACPIKGEPDDSYLVVSP